MQPWNLFPLWHVRAFFYGNRALAPCSGRPGAGSEAVMRKAKGKTEPVGTVASGAVPAEALEQSFPSIRLPIHPPYPPAEAKSVAEIPSGEGWLYEPKWDGCSY